MMVQPAKVALPVASAVTVVLVHENPIDGLPVTESTTESPLRPLPNASATVTTGCVVHATPAGAVLAGWVENVAVAAAAAVIVTEPLATLTAPSVAVIVYKPALVILQPANVARPLAFEVTVVLVHEKPTEGLPVTESTTESPLIRLPPASFTVTTGCEAKATPAVVVLDGGVEKVNVATGPVVTVTELLVVVIAPSVAVSV